MMGIKGLGGREGLRLLVVAIVAAGAAVGIVEATHSSKSTKPGRSSGSVSIATGGTPTGVSSGAGSPHPGPLKVAGGAAVERSLRDGVMTVVLDTPPTGLLSEQNTSIERGASVAAEELNAAGGLAHGVRIKLVTQSLDGLSAAALQGRLRSEAAAALILPCDTDSEQSLAAAGARFGMLMLAPCDPDPAAAQRYPTYWAVGASASEEAAELARFMVSDNFHRIFVVATAGARYAELATSAFRAAVQARGISVTGSAPVNVSSPTFAGVAKAMESLRPLPAGIFTTLPPPLVNQLASSLAAKGLSPLVLGMTAMDTPLTLSSGAKALEGASFVSYGFPRVNAAASRFASDYRSAFGRSAVGSFPGLGFETVRLLAAAAARGGSAEPSAIQRALSRGLTLEGVALASRTYEPGGDHSPAGEVGISKVFTDELQPVLASRQAP
jgi:ABC-type branched-subunit amino acid transport system substrate-binding protein